MSDDLESLRARVAQLEADNTALRQGSPAPKLSRATARVRVVLAVLLLSLAVVIAPVAAVGTWARGQLVDVEQFVETFAPLAHDPEVQAYVTGQVTNLIDANIDIDTILNDLVQGLSPLDLSPRAMTAVRLLTAPAAQGVRTLVRDTTESVVRSPQFARLWEVTLRQAHTRATAALRDDPGAKVRLSEDGLVTLELGPVVALVKQTLEDRGVAMAALIPTVDRSIPIVKADYLVVVRPIYQFSVVAGYWSPWLALGLLVAGLVVAQQRLRAFGWACVGFTGAFLLLGTGIGIGRRLFINSISPSIMPEPTAAVLFDRATTLMSPAITALTVLTGVLAVGAWLHGSSRPASAVRTAGHRALAAARDTADRNGIGTGAFGVAVERWRSVILVGAIVVGVVFIFVNRPATMASVLSTLAVVLVVMLVVELVRRPADAAEAAATAE